MKNKPLFLLTATAVTLGSFFVFISFLRHTAFAVDLTRPETDLTEIEVIRADETGIQFNVHTPSFQRIDQGNNIKIAGLSDRIADPGAPNLPFYSTYIALPPEAEVAVQVAESDFLMAHIEAIEPAADKEFNLDDQGLVIGTPRNIIAEDAAIYGRNATFPEAIYTLSEPVYYRDMRLVALQLYPVRYNPVIGELQQARRLEVSISFNGGRLVGLRPLSPASNQHEADFSSIILNYEQAQLWRSLPANVINTPETALPVGSETYKIAITEDGIYDVCRSQLAAAGMNVATVNPNTIQMLYRGEDVAYQFINDNGDNVFDEDECVRFYGWKFDGTPSEKNFITENVYWLWAGGNRTAVATATNQVGGDIKTTAWYTETREPELELYFTRADLADWATFPNEPDIWYWDQIGSNTTTKTYTMTIKEPDTSASTATFLAEFIDRQNNPSLSYSVTAQINNPATAVTGSWTGHKNVNVTGSFSPTYLQSGENDISLTLDLDQTIYLNRFTIGYMRHLIADNDQLIFTDETGGNQLEVSGFSSDEAVVWNITNPRLPTRINNPTANSGTYTFNLNHPAGTKFVATTESNVNIVSNANIERYLPPNIDPAGNDADWVAITHGDFLVQANNLAQHRASAQFGNLDTHVVDVEDVINQYGYGLPLPEAIRNYLTYALGNWATAPTYVTLIGDATINPRQINCSCPGYDNLVPTDLQFVDPYNGMVPVDHTFVMLTGDDLIADMAIGRFSVNSAAEAATVVNKIIRYENNLLSTAPNQGTKFLFVADNDDDGGFFCNENASTASHLPASFGKDNICLGTIQYPDTQSIKDEMFARINDGLFILNYRGHGSVNWWAGETGGILSTSVEDQTNWQNTNKPTFILSADCLDGFFALPNSDSISETYLRYDNNGANVGSAGMWSSTGLGLDIVHSVLHNGFYDGLFMANGRTTGEAINYSKLNYFSMGYHESELYTFTLQGDPAMSMDFQDAFIYLPTIHR